MLGKLFGWVGMIGGIAAVVAGSANVVGAEVANVAAVAGTILAAIANPIVRPLSSRQRKND